MRRLLYWLHASLLLALLPQLVIAQTPSIEYTLSARNPLSHLYEIQIRINDLRATSLDVAMPAWTPGVYAIRDFAGNVQQFEAATRQNRPLQFRQTDKQTWRISKAAGDDLTVRYRVYSNALTDEMADITPAAVFMYVVGQTQVPVTVRYEAEGNWKTYSALEKRGDRYAAPDYDTLISSPVFLGQFKIVEFKSGNTEYRVVFSNPKIQMTELQVEADLNDLADAAAAMFGSVPFPSYTYLVKVQPATGSSSVGYLNSSRLTVGENDFVNQSAYGAFLSAAAQAFTKAWYIRAARPRSMWPGDPSREAYSSHLWFTEGVAAYTADVLLLRSRILTTTEYFQKASAEVDALQKQPGRLVTSMEEASWNVWTRSENSINVTVPFVLKGKIAGLLLDAEIRGRTSGSRTLDDVLRHLVSESGKKHMGLEENALEQAIQTATGVNVREFFDAVVRGRSEIDYKRYLEQLGLSAASQKAPATVFLGIEFERADGNLARVRRVTPGSPAETAKLDGGDIILAMDSERVTFDNLISRIHSKPFGRAVSLDVLRGERLLRLTITPGLLQSETWSIGEAASTTPAQLKLRDAWRGATR